LVENGYNQPKMARDIDFQAPAGRESLWTTDKKVEFSHDHLWSPEMTESENFCLKTSFLFVKKPFDLMLGKNAPGGQVSSPKASNVVDFWAIWTRLKPSERIF
jgi:hypothetical protein